MDPIMVSLTARIIYEERLQSFAEGRYADSLGGPNRIQTAFAALVRRVRSAFVSQPVGKPVTATQEIARANG